jgi:hypothetical protein
VGDPLAPDLFILAHASTTAAADDTQPFSITAERQDEPVWPHSTRVHLPKMPFSPTQPLTRPRLFPI